MQSKFKANIKIMKEKKKEEVLTNETEWSVWQYYNIVTYVIALLGSTFEDITHGEQNSRQILQNYTFSQLDQKAK